MALRSPDFGNTWKLVLNTRKHRTADGELRRLQENAPTWEGYTVKFSSIKKQDYLDFKQYLKDTQGQVIILTDFEGRDWKGMIVSPNIVIERGKTDCDYAFSFDFEGNLVHTAHF